MAITYPRDLPAGIGFDVCDVAPDLQVVRAPTRGGLPQVVELGVALWRASYETAPLTEAKGLAVEAWLASLRGGMRLFRARHVLRAYAATYRTGYGGLVRAGGATAFDGTATVSSVGGTLDTLTLSTLPASFVLVAGDLISLTYATGAQGMHRIIEGGTASGSGVATVTIEPTVRPTGAAGQTVQLAGAWFKAVLDGTPQIRWQSGRIMTASFKAVQTHM